MSKVCRLRALSVLDCNCKGCATCGWKEDEDFVKQKVLDVREWKKMLLERAKDL